MFGQLLTMTQEEHDPPLYHGGRPSSKMEAVPSRDEIIHSGHFMVSDIDDSVQDGDDEDDTPAVAVPLSATDADTLIRQCGSRNAVGYDFEQANKETSNTYNFGPRSSKSVAIDATLTKLFQCMTLAYRGKLTSPRWKNFKGLKIRWKDKIRLNNIIWRAWHMQFVKKERRVVCEFQCPLDSETHCKPEAVVLEGKYWKRQIETIRAEYKSWRLFTQKFSKESIFRRNVDQGDYDPAFDRQPQSNLSAYSSSMIVDDDFFGEFSDTLLSCLIPNQPFAFPNPREIARAGIADFIQPGLVPFQPNLDDCMDTFDWFSDIFSVRLPPVVEEQETGNTPADLLASQSGNIQNGSDFSGLNFFGGRTASLSLGGTESSSQQQRQQQQSSLNDYQRGSSKNVFASVTSDLGLAPPDLSLFGGGSTDENLGYPNDESLLDDPSVAMEIGTPKMGSPLDIMRSSAATTAASKMQQTQPLHHQQQPSLQHHQQQQQRSHLHQQRQSPVTVAPMYSMTQSPRTVATCPPPYPPTSQAPQRPPPRHHQRHQPPRPQRSSLPTLLPGGTRPPATSSPEHQCRQSPLHIASAPTSPTTPLATTRKYVDILPDLPQVRRHTFQAYPTTMPNSGKNLVDILRSPTSVRQPVAIVPGPPPTPPPLPTHLLHQQQQQQRNSLAAVQLAHTGGYPTSVLGGPANQSRRSSSGLDLGHRKSSKKDEHFALPKAKVRARSRSGPNLGQSLRASPPSVFGASPILQQPPSPMQTATGACSPAHLAQPSVVNTAPASTATTATIASTTAIMPQSALLAQLLATGNYTTGNKVEAGKSSSPGVVPILPAAPNSQPQTVTVITPVTFASVAKVNDLQSRVLVGATSQVFGSLIPSGKIALPPSTLPSSSSLMNSLTQTACASAETSAIVSVNGLDTNSRSPTQAKPFRPKSDVERVQYKEHRRVCHINAEQKRRCNIKNGFETIHHLVPSLRQNPHGKISKAAMLLKAGEYIKQLKDERSQLLKESDSLKKQIATLNQTINLCHSQLPATGAPIPCQRPNKMQKLFEDYVRSRTLENWKFWIFSILIRPLMDSFNSMVSTANMDDMCRTVLLWLEQHCSLVALRPGVFQSLRHLSTTTNILSDPRQIQEEAVKAVRL